MSEIELVFRGAERRFSGSLFSMLLFKKVYWMQIFNQYLFNKKDYTCPLLDANISASIEMSLWRCITCYEHSMVKFVSTRDYLISPICVYIPERVSAYEGCTSANFPHYILSRDWDESFVSNGSEDILHDNKIYSCNMEFQINLQVSLWILFCFVLFSFATSLWLYLSTKNTGKAFIHMTKINCLVMTLYEVFNRLRSISFSFLGINEGIKRKHILHSSVADQSIGFLARSRVLPQRLNSREIGKTCQQKWKIQHQNHDDYDFLIMYEREPCQRHD